MQTRRIRSRADTAEEGAGDGSASADSPNSTDRYERSSERRGASSKPRGFGRRTKERADAKTFASARRVFGQDDGEDGERTPNTRATASERIQAKVVERDGGESVIRAPKERATASEGVEPDERSAGRVSGRGNGGNDERSNRAVAVSAQIGESRRSARRVSRRADADDNADDNATAHTPSVPSTEIGANERTARLEQARALLKQASAQPKAKPVSTVAAVSAARAVQAELAPFANSFEDADSFEPFEQCAPVAAEPRESGTPEASVYSRSSQRVRKTSAREANDPRRPQRSLKGRALAYLSRREYSRAELSRKLRPYVEEADSLETLLDSLERDGWLSNERFVESVVHRRASRMGGGRIISELKRHAVGDALISEAAGKLAQSETARARAVWEKKYGVLPETPAERAKQARFLAARGFSGGTIGKILKGGEEDWIDEPIDD